MLHSSRLTSPMIPKTFDEAFVQVREPGVANSAAGPEIEGGVVILVAIF
jgi:hypothetical protein